MSGPGGQEQSSSGTLNVSGTPAPRGSSLVRKKRVANAGSFASGPSEEGSSVPDAPAAPTYNGGGSRLDSAAGNLVTSQEAVENRKHVFMSLAIATFLSLVTYGIKWPK
jgi:hypothetical protein